MPAPPSVPVLVALALLAGCAADPKPSPATGADPGTDDSGVAPADPAGPTPWDPDAYLDDPGASAAFDPVAFEAGLTVGIAAMMSVTPDPVIDAYDAAMDEQEAYCPAWYEVDGNTFWYSSCTTSGGTWYSGYGFDTVYENAAIDESGNLWDLRAISGAATVRTAAGHAFHLGGSVQRGASTGEDGWELRVNAVQGSFASDDPAAADTWLGAGVAPYHYIYAAANPGVGRTGARYLFAQSTLGNLDASGLAISTPSLLIGTESIGWPCEAEASGSIALRMADGAWFELVFDVVETASGGWRMDGDCDGCGDVLDANGEIVGTACADLAPLLDWEESPWDD